MAARACAHIADRAHEIDVVDLFLAGNVVGRIVRPMVDAGHDDVAEIARIERLTQIAAAARESGRSGRVA